MIDFNSLGPMILTAPIEYDKDIPDIEFPRYILDIIKNHDGNQTAFVSILDCSMT